MHNRRVPRSPVQGLTPLTFRTGREKIRICRLGVNRPSLPSPQTTVSTVQGVSHGVLRCDPDRKCLDCHRGLINCCTGCGVGLATSSVVVASKNSRTILFTFLSYLGPNSRVVIPRPTCTGCVTFTVSTNTIVHAVSAAVRRNFSLPGIRGFRRLVGRHAHTVLVYGPGGPAKCLCAHQRVGRVHSLIGGCSLCLFSSRICHRFVCANSPCVSTYRLRKVRGGMILVSSISGHCDRYNVHVNTLVAGGITIHRTIVGFYRTHLDPPLVNRVTTRTSLSRPRSCKHRICSRCIRQHGYLVSKLGQVPNICSPVPVKTFCAMTGLPISSTRSFYT